MKFEKFGRNLPLATFGSERVKTIFRLAVKGLRPYLAIGTVSCRLLIQMVRMAMD